MVAGTDALRVSWCSTSVVSTILGTGVSSGVSSGVVEVDSTTVLSSGVSVVLGVTSGSGVLEVAGTVSGCSSGMVVVVVGGDSTVSSGTDSSVVGACSLLEEVNRLGLISGVLDSTTGSVDC